MTNLESYTPEDKNIPNTNNQLLKLVKNKEKLSETSNTAFLNLSAAIENDVPHSLKWKESKTSLATAKIPFKKSEKTEINTKVSDKILWSKTETANHSWNRITSPNPTTSLSDKSKKDLNRSLNADTLMAKITQQFNMSERSIKTQTKTAESLDFYNV